MRDIERIETKYQMNMKEAALIQKKLEQFIAPDPYSGQEGYRVRSVYFDTIYNKDFYAREASLTDRHHIRLRIYPDNFKNIQLELKEKSELSVRKRILDVTRQEAEALLRGDISWLQYHKDAFGRILYRKMTMEVYRPCVLIEYHRKAYMRQENSTRITFDTFIRSTEGSFQLFEEQPFLSPVGKQGMVTMELKYTDFFMSDLKSAFWTGQLRQEPAGKYQRARMIAMAGRNFL